MNTNNHISQEQLEATERYLNGTMEANERLVFDERLKTDVTFKNLFEATKTMILGIETAALKKELDTFHDTMDQGVVPLHRKKKGNSRYIYLAIAASLVLLVGLFWMSTGGSNTERLFAKHFTPDPGLPTTMSTTTDYKFYDAMVDYKSKKYATAIDKWEQIVKDKPNNDTLNYFLGVANLAEGNEAIARNYLEQAATNTQSFLQSDIYYYLGMALLKEGNLKAAKQNFNLSGNESSKLILKDLNK